MRHRYDELISISSTTGIPGSYVFSTNGMYDPNVTGTGHQPMFFDNMSLVYNHYTVFKSKITISAVSVVPFELSLGIDDDTNIPTQTTAANENSDTISRLVPLYQGRAITLTRNWSAKAAFGGDIFDNDDLQGNLTNNPVEQMYYYILARTADGSTNTIIVKVQLEYFAVWDELKTQASN